VPRIADSRARGAREVLEEGDPIIELDHLAEVLGPKGLDEPSAGFLATGSFSPINAEQSTRRDRQSLSQGQPDPEHGAAIRSAAGGDAAALAFDDGP
jgi:hypothetical protein